MTPLSSRARSLVSRAREEASPTPQDLAHLRARLAQSLAQQTSDPVLLPFSLSKLGGVLLAAAVGLGAWELRGALDGHAAARARLMTIAPVSAPPPPVPVVAALSCPPAPTCAPAEPAKAPPPRVVVCARPADATSAGPAGASHRDREQTLFSEAAARRDASAELELLILARVALDEDRPMDALGHAGRHEQLFPSSAFVEERLAIQVLAYCSAGNRAQAATRLQRLVELAPQSTYLPRVRGTCGDDFVDGESSPEPTP